MRLPGTYISPAETGFYYLQSRYYDPTIGRFINADGITTTGQGFIGYNMFAYCGNNPANRQDASGNAWNGTNTVAVCDGSGSSANDHISEYTAGVRRDVPELTDAEIVRAMGVTIDEHSVAARVKIKNSYKTRSICSMYQFAGAIKRAYPDAFSGTINGFVLEWLAHNVAYSRAESSNDKQMLDRAKDADFGNTIYNDNHGGVSILMWIGYFFINSSDATRDLIIHFTTPKNS